MTFRRFPAESEPIGALWTAWPSHEDWGPERAAARREIAAMCDALAAPPAEPAFAIRLLARDAAAGDEAAARAAPGEGGEALVAERRAQLDTVIGACGDIWLRDTGPVFVLTPSGPRAVAFRFDGWGGKYVYAGDESVAGAIAADEDIRLDRVDLVCEGGALETDGEGTLITTRACLLDRARNPSWTERGVETALRALLGVERILWLDDGLLNDHTDGHVDTLARFVRPGLVVCQAPAGRGDPNTKRLDAVARALDGARDADGRAIDVVRVSSPGLVADADGAPLPASHINFVRANDRLVVPVYGTPHAAPAIEALTALFPEWKVIPAEARALVTGGGAFHCVTCAVPPREARA